MWLASAAPRRARGGRRRDDRAGRRRALADRRPRAAHEALGGFHHARRRLLPVRLRLHHHRDVPDRHRARLAGHPPSRALCLGAGRHRRRAVGRAVGRARPAHRHPAGLRRRRAWSRRPALPRACCGCRPSGMRDRRPLPRRHLHGPDGARPDRRARGGRRRSARPHRAHDGSVQRSARSSARSSPASSTTPPAASSGRRCWRRRAWCWRRYCRVASQRFAPSTASASRAARTPEA